LWPIITYAKCDWQWCFIIICIICIFVLKCMFFQNHFYGVSC
jgi:hypothetical protein